jgi:hypothetical protein
MGRAVADLRPGGAGYWPDQRKSNTRNDGFSVFARGTIVGPQIKARFVCFNLS